MKKSAVRFRSVSKGFSYWTEREMSLKGWLTRLAKGKLSTGKRERIEVFRDLSFDILAGEFVAIMGRNGAGKSTTLKLISGIYEPDKGKIEVDGMIAPMIELGAGFDIELSGYENIFFNAAILGYSRKETLKNVQAIIDFSELGELIHMPTKNYSSGMLVRLGFAVATHLSAPILLIDEVLAVGDLDFQEKCIKKITQLHNEGRTILLVTHTREHALRFAHRIILIDNGQKVYDGPPGPGVDLYTVRTSQPSATATKATT